MTLGATLKKLRNEAGLSVSELSQRSGVSVGMISQTERGQSNPSLKILDRLAQALNARLADLIEPEAPVVERNNTPAVAARFIRRKAERPRFDVGPLPLTKEMLSPQDTRNLQFMIINFPPQGRSDDVIQTPGEKAGLVIKGSFRISVDNTETLIEEGDSFQFDSELPHWVKNERDEVSVLMWIMVRSNPLHQI